MNCYRFDSREQFSTLAAAEGLVNDDGELITCTHDYSIDEVGVIYHGGTYDEQGEVIEPPVAIPGWHVNTLGLSPESWDQYLCIVNHPVRVFAGGEGQVPSTTTLEEIISL